MADRFLRLSEVIARTGLSRSTIYLRIAKGEFPKQASIGPNASAWLASEIDAWIAARIAERDRKASPDRGARLSLQSG